MRSIRRKKVPVVFEASEDIIHVSILDYLDWNLPKHSTMAWHSANGGKRNVGTGRKMKALGVRAGFPDLAFLCDGKLYTLEVKTSTGKQRQTQEAWEKYITDAGGFYAIVRSIDETEAALKKWGIL